MDEHQVLALAALLQLSLDHVVIKDDSWNQHMSMDTYRRNLQQLWSVHDADLNLLLTTRYKPIVEDAALGQELLQAIIAELEPHIHEDKIQTAAAVAIGGPGTGFPLEHLVRHILNIAIVRGPLFAAYALYRCVEAPAATYQLFGLLPRVQVEQELQISQGIRLVPIPNSTDQLPSHLPLWPYWNPLDLLGRTLIAIDRNISPVFLNPRLIEMNPMAPFTDAMASTEYPDFSIERFCQAMSLAADASIVCAAKWTHIEPTEVFNVWGTYSGGSHTYSPELAYRIGSVNVTREDISKALAIYRQMQDLAPSVATKLRVPIDRWIKAKAEQSAVDAFIDLGIALESLYLQDIGDRSEMGFRLRLRAAWYLAKDRAGREKITRNLRDVYNLRSKAVHTGEIGPYSDALAPLTTGQQLCRQSIVKVILNGGFPNWHQLVLGEEGVG